MTVREFLQKHPVSALRWVRPHAMCADGFLLSIQASEYHYCSPRQDNAPEYQAVEIMVLSGTKPRSLRPYSAGGDVYGYVPMAVAERLVKRHGGIGAVIL